MASNTDYAYAAGLIDGEGSISLSVGKTGAQTACTVIMTSKEVLEWLKEKFNGTLHYNMDLRSNLPQHHWRLSPRRGLLYFLQRISAYSKIKKYKIDIVIEYLRNHRNRKHPTLQERELAKKMNARGGRPLVIS